MHTAQTAETTIRVLAPAGIQVYVGGFPVTLRYDTVFDCEPFQAPLIRMAVESQLRQSER